MTVRPRSKLLAGWVLGYVLTVSAMTAAYAGTGDKTPPAVSESESSAPDADSPAALLSQARVLVQQGRLDQALVVTGDLLERDPDDFQAAFLHATILGLQGREREAIDLQEELYKKTPDNSALINNLAWVLVTAEDPSVRNPERALNLAREALLIDPDNPHIWSTVAEAHFANGNFSQSAVMMTKALETAARLKKDPETIRVFREQLGKAQRAALVMSLIE